MSHVSLTTSEEFTLLAATCDLRAAVAEAEGDYRRAKQARLAWRSAKSRNAGSDDPKAEAETRTLYLAAHRRNLRCRSARERVEQAKSLWMADYQQLRGVVRQTARRQCNALVKGLRQ